MKIGLYVSPQYTSDTALTAGVSDLFAQVRTARDAGFSSVWAPHHFVTHPMRMLQTQLLLARLAAEAEGMEMGPAVLLLPMLNPVMVAEEAATLDQLTGGRYVLAVGQGYREEEFAVAGVPAGEKTGRLIEAVRLIRMLWAQERVTFEGRYFSVDDVGLSVRPLRPGGCPIWIGGSVRAAVERAARHGDAWIGSFSQTFDELLELGAAFRAARGQAGLAPATETAVCRECHVGSFSTVRAPLLAKYEAYASWGNANMGEGPLSARFDGFAAEHFLIGDAAEVTDRIHRMREEIGVTHLILRFQWLGLEQEEVLAAIRRMEQVIARI